MATQIGSYVVDQARVACLQHNGTRLPQGAALRLRASSFRLKTSNRNPTQLRYTRRRFSRYEEGE